MSDSRLVDDSLFVTDAAQVTLRGASCDSCGTTTFPFQRSCPRCGSAQMEAVALPRLGKLWSFTIQGFEPKAPYRGDGRFTPYGVGYVDLGPVIVETRLTENNANALDIGAAMDLVLIPAFQDDDGTAVLTYAFAQAGEPA